MKTHRRPLLGALQLRHGAGRGHGPRRREAARRGRAHAARLRARRARRGESRARARHDPRRRGHAGHRQADARRVARHPRPRRLARAAHRRVHGQGGQGHHPRRSRSGRPAGGLRRRSRVRLPAARGRRRTPRRTRRSPRSRRPGKPVVRIRVATQVRPRRGVRPLGNRDGDRGRDHRHQPVQPARRRGQQDRDASRSPPSTRRPGKLPRGVAVLRGRRRQALRRREERRGAARARRARRRRWPRT